jgi:hypothetical protein
MNRTPVESSCVASIGYNAATRVLEVEFLSGSVYEYSAVPEDVFGRWMLADSKGAFFNTEIFGAFAHRKVFDPNVCPTCGRPHYEPW